MADSMLDIIRRRLENVRAVGTQILQDHAGLHPANNPGDVVWVVGNFWNPLPPEAKKAQARLVPEWDRLAETVRTLSLSLPDSAQQDIEQACSLVRDCILQDYSTWLKTVEEAVEAFGNATETIAQSLDDYFRARSDIALVIADTNALLANPNLENWAFDGVVAFEIVLTPTILAELNSL